MLCNRLDYQRIEIIFFSDYNKSLIFCNSLPVKITKVIIKRHLDRDKLYSNTFLTHSNTNIYNHKTSFVYDLLIWSP